ncbi:MAG TPA: hypothetical protein VHS56_07125 [Candidatus Cybelea sp.]|jgi:hypothetical protein|nr:hypothetical protein [Candidatus Cybelea sp.]
MSASATGSLCAGALAAFLAGCGGSPAAFAPGAAYHVRGSVSDSSGDLLYVAQADADFAYIYTYPEGRLVTKITRGISGALGMCTDAAGNVYITSALTPAVVEYAHGATSPLATFYEDSGKGGQPNGCSVDVKTGNLAVVNGIGNLVGVFSDPNDEGTYYMLSGMSAGRFCGYDDKGNLFIDGPRTSGGSGFVLAELPAGGKRLQKIKLDKRIGSPGAIQWDGRYVTVAAIDATSSVLYRVRVAGSNATVMGTTPLGGEKTVAQSVIFDSKVIAPYAIKGVYRKQVGVWRYPQGGKVTQLVRRAGNLFYGLAISSLKSR